MKLVTVAPPLSQVPVGKVFEFKSPRTTISVKRVNMFGENKLLGMLVTPAPRVDFVKFAQPEKALDPKVEIFPLIVISVNLRQE